MKHFKEFLIEKYGESTTDNEILEYQNRLNNFLELLIEIDKKQKEKSK